MSNSVLAIGAHPDDVEFGCGGTLLKHIADGDNVMILHMTNTGYSNLITEELLRSSNQSIEEAQDSAKILGCDVKLLNFEEQKIPFNVNSVVEVEKIILENNVNIIYTHSEIDYHQDHVATYKTVMAASRNVNNIFLFEQLPLPRVRKTDNPNYFVDISDFITTKIDACRAHKSQVAGKYGEKIIDSLISLAKFRGAQCGLDYAEAFYSIKQLS